MTASHLTLSASLRSQLSTALLRSSVTGMRDGIIPAFEEANRAGGVNGRKVYLDSFDDGY